MIGDDFLVTNAGGSPRRRAGKACNAALIKVNQAGTITEAKAASTLRAAPAGARSSRPAPARPRTSRSSIWRWVGTPDSSRSARSRAPNGWRNGTRPAHRGGAGRKGRHLRASTKCRSPAGSEAGRNERWMASLMKKSLSIESGALAIPEPNAGGNRVYKGIVYAAPPIGPLRWRPPEPVAPWTGDACVWAAFRAGRGVGRRRTRVRPLPA